MDKMSEIVISLTTICITLSMLVSIVLCICLKRSKTNTSLNNRNNLLPLNSIRSSDLTNNLELIRYNGGNGITCDETDSHLRHTQRALPDIPSVTNSSRILPSNDSIESKDSSISIEPMSRPLKSRAPQPPTHRVMTCPIVPTDDDLHHSYARIKDNVIIDSSENDETDDYCDPQLCSVRKVSHNTDDRSPPVPTKRFNNDLNNDLGFNPSLPSTSRAAPEMTYLSQLPVHHLNDSNIDSYSHSSNEENGMNSNRTEISYNTISVREPLAKVLAERTGSEHHYNEVEEERVSSFYEEIAGSTSSSVTYSKIGDILSNNPNVLQNSSQEMQTNNIGHNNHTSDPMPSAPQQSFASITPDCDTLLANYPKDLYSSVDKKSKSYNRQTIHCIPDLDNEFDNLYAKVQKQVNNTLKEDSIYANQRPSSATEMDSDFITDNSIPPPLPPPLKSFNSSQFRSARTISLYDSPNSDPNQGYSHQRRYSSGNQSIDTNDWQKRSQNNDYFNYGTVGNNEMDLETDPGYEVITRKKVSTHIIPVPILSNVNGIHSGVDPGYEAIRYEESDNDPNYEVITKKVNTNTKLEDMRETVDPGYEVIKRVPQMRTQTRIELNISRNVSDVSTDPGYERIRFTQNSIQQIESEPNYASICRTNELYEDEDEEEETVSERL